MSPPPEGAPGSEQIVPARDWKLGQSDKTTAGCLWTLVLGCVLYGLIAFFVMLLNARGTGPPGAVAAVVLCPIVLALLVLVGFVRLMSTGRWAGYGRLDSRLRRAHPTWARVRVKEPPMLLFGLPLLWGRKGTCFVAADRVVLLVRRVHPMLAWVAFAVSFQGLNQVLGGSLGSGFAVGASIAGTLVAVALFLLAGADVHEIQLTEFERIDAEEGHVTWTQSGDDAPRVLRLRVTHPDDAAATSKWLSSGGGCADRRRS